MGRRLGFGGKDATAVCEIWRARPISRKRGGGGIPSVRSRLENGIIAFFDCRAFGGLARSPYNVSSRVRV